ncbi:AbrB/MazE/SpoVT family DNA-binding domain-containing protein [Methanobrevibacter filiformis]|uniref:SpoVT / AbrB like domain protein n=1 Tax=Methanobrevibacter filiformis TaxID=55758 RepID=A0A166B4W4_9EURY|nr:AbrB/MazE/SpoVT family DNA-binding domain-containing protein [Methanobrevibacter filiformis]KZX12866.1 SpoVT / AbrB like domain protein [Methanobrevibacter filiformis]
MISTKVCEGYRTVIPAEIRKKFNIEKSDILDWKVSGDEIILKVKKADIYSIIGIISDDTLDSVESTR